MKRTLCLSLSLLVLLSLFSPFAYSEDGVVTIGSVEDLIRFSESCKVESFSAGKVFSLTADLNLTDSGFVPISYFAGTFRGNNHTISGLSIGGDGSRQGLFRRTSAASTISDLRVEGIVTPGGTGQSVGGVVGENRGKLERCHFEGRVSGIEAAGGIVGHNTASGQIQSCGFCGEIHGEHRIGGIVGWNEGSVSSCTNTGAVNTVPVTPQEQQMDLFNLSLLDVSSVTSDDFLDITDIGGICGENGGVISNCRSSGTVGYPNTAYNVGGIVGKTTGFVTGCENAGAVQGRKDVGGIAGQLIPYTELDLSRSKLDALRGEINALKELIAIATRDANHSAAWIAGDLNGMDQAVGWVLSLLRQYVDMLDAEDWRIIDRIQEAIQVDPETGELIVDPSVRYEEETGEYWFGDDIRFNPQTGQIWKDGVLLLPPDTASLAEALNSLYALSAGLNDQLAGSAGTLSTDLNNINNQMAWVFDTLFSTVEDLTDLQLDIEDLSLAEAYRHDRGAIANSKNTSAVSCETNGGGIVGASAFEIAFDMEDWLNTSDLLLSHGTQFLFAATRDCESSGEVTVGKHNAGGIVGLVDVGTVVNCTARGSVLSSGGDQVGGLAGRSRGSVVNCRVCIVLSGGKYVGGIVGLGQDVFDCCAVCQVERASEYAGAVAGWAEGTVKNNVYTLSTFAGVDDASLTGECAPVSEEEFLQLDGVPEDFTTVQVRFLCEDKVVKTLSLPFGDELEQLPEIPNRDAWYWVWDAVPGLRIYQSMDITGSYQMPIETLATGEEPPEFLAEGQFYSGQVLAVTPVELENQESLIRAATLCVDGFEGRLTVRMLTGESGELFVLHEDGSREALTYQRDGRYIVFAIQNRDSIVYMQADKPSVNPRVILLTAFSGVGVLLIALSLLRRRKKKTEKQKAKCRVK
ncbi:MAG: hypothetical protein K6C08_06460 [Oscillospiraceae bacterium]|nr:hypothetical protein [Oscillospiraceae bacterium]